MPEQNLQFDLKHSATVVYSAAVAKHRFVNWAGAHAIAAEDVQGISELAGPAGGAGSVVTSYSFPVMAAAAIPAGSAVAPSSDGTGRAVVATGLQCGRALTAAAAAGELVTVRVLLVAGGILPAKQAASDALVSGYWSQYTAQPKTDADALASVLYSRTFQPGELIAGDALIAEGLLTVPNSAAVKRVKFQIGGIDYMAIDLSAGSSTFHWRAKMRMRSLTSQVGWAVGSANGAYGSTGAATNVVSAIDFSAPVVMQLTAQWPVAGAGTNSIVSEAIDLERFRPAA